MKVYIVTEGSYSDYHIEEVFTNKEQAELYCAIHEDCRIEEYEADECKIDGKAEDLKSIWVLEKGLDYQGLKYQYLYKEDNMTFDDIDTIDVRRFPRPLITLTKTFKRDTEEEKVRKIMQDKYAQLEYEAQAAGEEKRCEKITKI